MNQKITLALIGAGERGQYCYAPYAKLHGYEVCFTAVADPHDGRRKEFMQDYQVRQRVNSAPPRSCSAGRSWLTP